MAFLFDWQTMEQTEYTHDKDQGSVVRLGERNYLMISGTGDETSTQFQTQAAAILALSEQLTKAPEEGNNIPGFRHYVHYPLNVEWQGEPTTPHEHYRLFVKQPNFMTQVGVEAAMTELKSTVSPVADIKFIRFEEGLEGQIGFNGLSEKLAAEKLNEFISKSPFKIDQTQARHRELYLSALAEVGTENQQVILRQPLLIKDSQLANQYPLVIN